MSCLVVGDSLAVGLAAYLKACAVSAAVGASSAFGAAHTTPHDVTFYSGGSNDGGSVAALDAARARAGGRFVVVLPNNRARRVVATWAARHGVPTISARAGKDGVHPKSYPALAAQARRFIRK